MCVCLPSSVQSLLQVGSGIHSSKVCKGGAGGMLLSVPTRLSPVVSSQPLVQGATRDLTSSPV